MDETLKKVHRSESPKFVENNRHESMTQGDAKNLTGRRDAMSGAGGPLRGEVLRNAIPPPVSILSFGNR